MKDFGWNSFLIRFIFATVIVFSTYNPEGYSYFHWATESFSIFNVYKAFTGVILFIAWAILIRASLGSLGVFGLSLASVFFGLLIWLIIDVLGLTANSMRSISYIVEIMIASVLSIGVSWSHIRRRVSGQVDTDELDRES